MVCRAHDKKEQDARLGKLGAKAKGGVVAAAAAALAAEQRRRAAEQRRKRLAKVTSHLLIFASLLNSLATPQAAHRAAVKCSTAW